ncbi:MAG TPA: iron-containing redox enzyme family protein [Anaeromyxobacteraceae bacterium]
MDPHQLHVSLARFGRQRLEPAFPGDRPLPDTTALARLEAAFLEEERLAASRAAALAPSAPDAFVAWFEALRENGPGQGDPLFSWLAEEATLAQMRWFLAQEVAGEAGFDDLVALTQVKMPVRAKLELARNYWDEMGRGRAAAMHGPLLGDLARALGVEARPESTVWEALALANLLVALALDRRHAYQSVGALGAIELTAPGRVALVDRGLARLGVGKSARRYFTLHATLDLRHSAAWNREVLRTLVEEEPRAARAIAEGALMRLQAGARCFERYRRELGLSGKPAEAAQPVPFAP